MSQKQRIRYLGFRSTSSGGRCFDFIVSDADRESEVSVEIGQMNFVGIEKILVQEGPGVCYAKILELCENGMVNEKPLRFKLTDADIQRHRQAARVPGRPARPLMGRTG